MTTPFRPDPGEHPRSEETVVVRCTPTELVDIERARLVLRRDHGLTVDRSRLLVAAFTAALADLDERGADATLVQWLRPA